MSKEGFTLETVYDGFDCTVSEKSETIQSYWIIDDNEYASIYDIDASNVRHHLDERYKAAIRGLTVEAWAKQCMAKSDTVGNIEASEYWFELFGLEL